MHSTRLLRSVGVGSGNRAVVSARTSALWSATRFLSNQTQIQYASALTRPVGITTSYSHAHSPTSCPTCSFSTSATPAVKPTTAQIKSLRESSGAPITECRDALQGVLSEGKTDVNDAGAVMQAAIEWLRKKGISTAAKKSGRAASEGLVSVCVAGNNGAVIELNSETDFAARNKLFRQLCVNISKIANEVVGKQSSTAADLLAALQSTSTTDASGPVTVGTAVTNIIASLRENIQLRRVSGVQVKQGVIGSYMHNAVDLSEGEAAVNIPAGVHMRCGRQGAIIGLQTEKVLSPDEQATLQSLANKLAMHIVASSPRFISQSDIPPEVIANEKTVLTEQAHAPPIPVPGQPIKKEKPKSAKQVEMMVEGRIKKWLQEIVLLDQQVVVSSDAWDMAKPPTIGQILEQVSKQLNTKVTVTGMERFLVGEGVITNKSGDSFAKEVAEKLAKAK